MKKRLTSLLAVLCLCALLLSLPVHASAVQNVIVGGSTGGNSYSGYSAGPSVNDIYGTQNGRSITLPSYGCYYPDYYYLYVCAPGGNSAYVYDRPSSDNGYKGVVYQGTRVLGVAYENGFVCGIYFSNMHEYLAGWISLDVLSGVFPGPTLYAGSGRQLSNCSNIGDAVLSWSKDCFVGTGQKYTLLSYPADNCMGFTLDYQVIGRNGAKSVECCGPRTIYVNSGSGWVNVGTFAYDKIQPVHVEVTLDKPIRLAAVAVTASCAKPDTFYFRQSVLDVMCRNY